MPLFLRRFDPKKSNEAVQQAHRWRRFKDITENLVQESGQFRTVSVVVVNSKHEVLHSGADFQQVLNLLAELLEWGKTADTHALIKSSAIHFYDRIYSPFLRWQRTDRAALANAYSLEME
jgi:hypothetical protein